MSTKEFQLQDVLDIQWGDTNTTKASYVPAGYLAFSASGPDGFLEKFDYDREGIVLSAIGANCGSTFFASGKWSCIKNTIRILPKSESVDLRYFYYMTKSPDFWPIRGSAQPFISQTDIREMYAEFPEIEAQRRVADLLSRIDRLIKKNQKLSSILEEIAERIFKSWFIDFDPVKAKMAGESPVGMDAETAALFSTSIREASEGSIPGDWEWGSVGTIADVIDCLHSKKPSLIDQGKPFLQLNTIADDGILRYELAACVSDEDYSKWTSRIEVSGGDCVVTNVGRVGAVSQIPHHFKAAIGRNMTAVRPREKDETASFLFSALTSDFMRREIEANTDSGTILDALNVKNIPLLRIPIPPRALIRKFEEVVSPMIRHRHELHRENVALSSTRDALLPRLISGELKIPDEMLAA